MVEARSVITCEEHRTYIMHTTSSGIGICGGGGYAARLFLLISFPCSADHERDWLLQPCKKKIVFFGLATNTLENVEGLDAFRFFFKQQIFL